MCIVRSMDTQSLVDIVKSWVTLDNQIRAVNQKLKVMREEKKKQNQLMIDIMKANEIDNFDVKDGQIRYKKETKREALTQKTLLAILSKHPQLGGDQARHLNQFIYDNRKVTEKEVIVRKVDNETDNSA
jgi:hypothetical protein